MCRRCTLPVRRARSEAVLSPRILGGCLESARALLGDRALEETAVQRYDSPMGQTTHSACNALSECEIK